MIKEDIENNLKTSLDVIFLEVINESNTHNVPDGAESHFKITIVSDIFEDNGPVYRSKKACSFEHVAQFGAAELKACSLEHVARFGAAEL